MTNTFMDIECPRCGSRNVSASVTTNGIVIYLKCRCNKCGKTWKIFYDYVMNYIDTELYENNT